VAKDGSRVAFLRSPAGDDPNTCLWVLDVDTGRERLVADPRGLHGYGDEALSAEERARRERARETAGGIVQYAADPSLQTATFVASGALYAVDVSSGRIRAVETAPNPFDPRPDPTLHWVAYTSGGALRLVSLQEGEASGDRLLVQEDHPDVSWGVAEFVAAEEMDRLRGHWWSPDGTAIAAARVDVGPVLRWHIVDPANPDKRPVEVAYPAAGTDNAVVTLHVLGLDGSRADVDWDRDAFPYLVEVVWPEGRPLTVLVQSRDQRRWVALAADSSSGSTRTLWEDRDDHWLTIVPGVPAWTDDGRLVMTADREDSRALLLDGEAVTPPGIDVQHVLHVSSQIVFTAWDGDPTQTHLWRLSSEGKLDRLSEAAGVHSGEAGAGILVVMSASMDYDGVRTEVRRGDDEIAQIPSHAETPLVRPNVSFLQAGKREIGTAVLFPQDNEQATPLPVLVDPYGGPHFQRVIRSRNAYLESQWFADQGFAVVIADGRGTPGRGVSWEKAIHLDVAAPVLEDQVDALHGAADQYPQLDLSRVAIRGWSFGGYLAALAVLRRPDVFHAAISGAPVTDERLYDTHYTERYLGHPDEHPDVYDRNSLLADARQLERPLLLIHGLADDNVVVAHTLRLSQALLEAERPHRVLPLAGITHMTPAVTEHLLFLQLHFLREALGLDASAMG
jgi:dipeptidyl-peptidase-4